MSANYEHGPRRLPPCKRAGNAQRALHATRWARRPKTKTKLLGNVSESRRRGPCRHAEGLHERPRG
eukprot:983492-Lingulodinium_polyedra.AAC.1